MWGELKTTKIVEYPARPAVGGTLQTHSNTVDATGCSTNQQMPMMIGSAPQVLWEFNERNANPTIITHPAT
jgi:hypothetical protein